MPVTAEQLGSALRAIVDYLAPLAAAAWPTVAPLVGVLVGARITTGQQRRARQFQLTDAKLQRLRAAFKPVLLTAWAFNDATSLGATRPQADEDAAREVMIAEAMTGLNDARAALALETDASKLNDAFQKLYAAYALYRMTVNDVRAGDIPPPGQRLSDKRERVMALATQLESDMRETLAKLERDAV